MDNSHTDNDPPGEHGRSGEGAASIIPHLPDAAGQVKAQPAPLQEALPPEDGSKGVPEA